MTQKYRFINPKRILAFDPGEVWCGLAVLDWDNPDSIIAESRVLSMADRTLADFARYVDFYLPAYVVCEDFRIQPVGHNRFSAGHTLRLIGAIETVTALNPKSRWDTVPPGNAKREVPELFGSWYEDWATSFPHAADSKWRHAQSAWRVMGRHLWVHNSQLLIALRTNTYQTSKMPSWMGRAHTSPQDLVAPALRTTIT